jgi:hypothetical protein
MTIQNQAAPQAKARAGRWSIVLAVVALILLSAGAVGVVMTQGDLQGENVPWITAATTVISLWLSRLFNLIGAALGIIAIIRGGADRIGGIIGLIINVAMIYFGGWVAGQLIVLFAGI